MNRALVFHFRDSIARILPPAVLGGNRERPYAYRLVFRVGEISRIMGTGGRGYRDIELYGAALRFVP